MRVLQRKQSQTLTISQEVMDAIRDHIGLWPAERGGMLGCDADGVVRHFVADPTARCTGVAYDPDIPLMNKQIKQWKTEDISFCGFVHSHPKGVRRLSDYDKWYAGEIFGAFSKLEVLWLPLVQTYPDTGQMELIPYGVLPGVTERKKCSVFEPEFEISGGSNVVAESNSLQHVSSQPVVYSKPSVKTAHSCPLSSGTLPLPWKYFGNFTSLGAQVLKVVAVPPSQTLLRSEQRKQALAVAVRNRYVQRQGTGWDLDLMDDSRLVVIGTGGAAGLIQNCARMGFGEFVLIDPDYISQSNVATQQVRPSDIGVSKVEALGRNIVELNPAAAVYTATAGVESLDDSGFERLLQKPLRAEYKKEQGQHPSSDLSEKSAFVGRVPSRVILLVLTDNFEAQARGHRLGLQFGLPTICAQEYMEGRGAEMTYTVPGVTAACHRCITASRYRAYLAEGYKNDVTSEGAPIFAAEYLNATLGHLLLAIAHHGSNHPRWGNLISRLANKNLIRLRMDPDFDQFFGNTFERRLSGAAAAESLVMFDALFLPQSPDAGQTDNRPVCPDCGGTGDLFGLKGSFEDTRIMRHSRQQVA